MTPTEKIDAALDSVLRAGNLKRSYSSSQELDRMRLAMKKILFYEFSDGVESAYAMVEAKRMVVNGQLPDEAMKGK